MTEPTATLAYHALRCVRAFIEGAGGMDSRIVHESLQALDDLVTDSALVDLPEAADKTRELIRADFQTLFNALEPIHLASAALTDEPHETPLCVEAGQEINPLALTVGDLRTVSEAFVACMGADGEQSEAAAK